MAITMFSATREHTQWSIKVRKDGTIIELTYPLDSEPELAKILEDAESLPEFPPSFPEVPEV